ncbi:MAG TPA: hypothetical protein DCS67_02650 [Clostridiales bacterium UBA8960]|nr:hypothetical protein [Clostridiales bacterium UBA8960]
MKRYIRLMLFLLIAFVLIATGCSKKTAYEDEPLIDWSLYQPNRTMVQYFTGGYENEGHMIIIDILNDTWMQQKVLSTGAATYAVFQIHDGLAIKIDGKEAGDFSSLDAFWDMDYTETVSRWSDESLDESNRYTKYKWEKKNEAGQTLTNEAFLETNAFTIGNETFDALKVITQSEGSEEYRISYHIEGFGQVQNTWMMKGETGDVFATHEDKLVSYAYIDGLNGSYPEHKINVLSGLAEREGFDFALPMSFDRYSSPWLLVTNPSPASTSTSPELIHMILDLSGNVLKQFKIDPPKPFSSISYVGSPTPYHGIGSILECNTVDVQGEPIIEVYWFINRNWLLIDQFKPSPPMSQNNLPTSFVFTVNIIGDYVVYATGMRDEANPENLIWKVYDRRVMRTIQTFSVSEHYFSPSNVDELFVREGFYRIAFDRTSEGAIYLNIETGELLDLQTP